MARGTASKQQVAATILETFKDSFSFNNGKEIRIRCMEDGAEVQVKVVLTAAKENVSPEQENAVPGTAAIPQGDAPVFAEKEFVEPSEEEVAAVNNLLSQLGL